MLPIHIQSEKSNIQSENIVHNDTYSVEGPLALLILYIYMHTYSWSSHTQNQHCSRSNPKHQNIIMHHKTFTMWIQHPTIHSSIHYKNFILHSNEKKVFYSFNAIFVKLNSNNTLHTQYIYTTKIYVVVGRYQTHSIARFWIWYSFFWNKSNVCIYAFCVLRFNRLLVFFILKKYFLFFFSFRRLFTFLLLYGFSLFII